MDYRETLNLPKTDFPMKANLTEREPEILKHLESKKIYEKLQQKNKDLPVFILHDGPPYANGHIHIGHALNKILKDIIVKFKSMEGYSSPFVPGWDCHGLPIEHQVDKGLGDKKESISIEEKRQLCKEYAERFIHIQREEFKRLGVFGDWGSPYRTMDYKYEATIVREFGKFVGLGAVYKGRKPVYWCPTCVTALAEAEVEYMDRESPSIYVKFKVKNPELLFTVHCSPSTVYFVIWTTTPWTLPANLALCLHPEYDYVAVSANNEVYLVAEGLLNDVMERLKVEKYEVLHRIKGKELEGIHAEHPFIKRESIIILGEYVTLDQGTGVVHTAPGHGQEDYEMGIKYGLDILSPVDDHGRFTSEVERFSGQNVFRANKGIIERLRELGALLYEEKIIHSYPHCWRCKKPVIFRATEQWFISMETNNLRKKALEGISSVTWIPHWGGERIYGMIENRPDWCISRQRAWGVPITLLSCIPCGVFLMDRRLVECVADIIEKEGADAWFTKTVSEFLPPDIKCPSCGSREFKKETGILDVWFDSGVSHAAVLKEREELRWPADLYLEGSDQHRGWFQSSLLTSVGADGIAPYRTVLTHGFVVDGEGKKMSKSAGNVIAPQEVINRYGAEILRLWVSAQDYKEDIRISDEILRRLVEAYRKIRNTCRYLLGNLYDFKPDEVKITSDDLMEIDRWALLSFQRLVKKCLRAYREYEFHVIFHSVYNFCAADMSAFYLDVLKDRVYTYRADSKERKTAQWTMHYILHGLIRLIAPILSFTAEEVRGYLPDEKGLEESVFLYRMPSVDEKYLDEDLDKRWEKLLKVREEVNKQLEIARKEQLIGNSLEAKVSLYLSDELMDFLSGYGDFLPTLFITSAVTLNPEKDAPSMTVSSTEIRGLKVLIERADGLKCERCWNYSNDVGKYPEHPTICDRCFKAIR
ncbi:MAG: isoleucine--tRNA ligase [Nitrospirota bacterium]